MAEAENLFGEEHVRRYRETGGRVGHTWREGATILLLTTTGRTSGEARTTPLIYAEDGDRYVIVASKGRFVPRNCALRTHQKCVPTPNTAVPMMGPE